MYKIYHCIDIFERAFETMLSDILNYKIGTDLSKEHYIITNEPLHCDKLYKRNLEHLTHQVKQFYVATGYEIIIEKPLSYVCENSVPYDEDYLYFTSHYLAQYQVKDNLLPDRKGILYTHINFYYVPSSVESSLRWSLFTQVSSDRIPIGTSLHLLRYDPHTHVFYSSSLVGKESLNEEYIENFIQSVKNKQIGYEDEQSHTPYVSSKADSNQPLEIVRSRNTPTSKSAQNEQHTFSMITRSRLRQNNEQNNKRGSDENSNSTPTSKKKKVDGEELTVSHTLRSSKRKDRTSPDITDTTSTTSPSRISIDDPNVNDFISNYRDSPYTYIPDDKSHQYQLSICEVTCLKSPGNKKTLGIFANQEIDVDTVLGCYLGSREKITAQSASHTDGDGHYLFEINETTGINADQEGNWTSLVNGVDSHHQANIIAVRKGKNILYIACKPIKAEDQLVIHYGKNYLHNNETFRYCRPSDLPIESKDILAENKGIYSETPRPLEAEVAAILGAQPNDLFYIPTIDQTNMVTNWDRLPLLKCDESGTVLQQYQQNNMTPLMYECATGDPNLVEYLLEQGADPNAQASIDGYAPLHLVIKSRLRIEVKKEIMRLLLDKKASLTLQDRNDQSILHEAINAPDGDDLTMFLLETATNLLKTDEEKREGITEILDVVNKDELDLFLYSLLLKKPKTYTFLSSYLDANDIEAYLTTQRQIISLHADDKLELGVVLSSVVAKLNNSSGKIRLINQLASVLGVKSTDISQKRQKFRHADTKNSSTRFFNPEENLFEQIMTDSRDNSSDKFIKELDRYFSINQFRQQSRKDKKHQLTNAASTLLDHGLWYMTPYRLSRKRCNKMQTDVIYLFDKNGDNSCFDCKFQNLDGEQVDCTIEFNPPNENPSLEDVIVALESQSGHNISDQKRIEYAGICLTAATTYCDKLKRIDGDADELRASIDDASSKLDSLCNSEESSSNSSLGAK